MVLFQKDASMCGWCSSSWMILFPNLLICLPLPLLFNWNEWLQTMRMKINKLWLRWVCSHCPSPPSCNLLFLFLIFLFFYYLMNCITSIVVQRSSHPNSIAFPSQTPSKSPLPREVYSLILYCLEYFLVSFCCWFPVCFTFGSYVWICWSFMSQDTVYLVECSVRLLEENVCSADIG